MNLAITTSRGTARRRTRSEAGAREDERDGEGDRSRPGKKGTAAEADENQQGHEGRRKWQRGTDGVRAHCIRALTCTIGVLHRTAVERLKNRALLPQMGEDARKSSRAQKGQGGTNKRAARLREEWYNVEE